ncbi:dipeptidase PepE [Kangiella profundi]|uniref:dipeptidase E n=1 Tax=Kangiella profundi TaxID=1561924 RepID=A0A2K9AKE5_9GAMM|nr:dipeptidase PepE [Kangiella profundi]AUD79414.1 dipeptidase PepE [Kangiella profundi]GGE98698.1 peptidase E [Kangiella profundi]
MSQTSQQKLLLLSASREGQTDYLEHVLPMMDVFLPSEVKEILFIPYAGFAMGYDAYEAKVSQALQPIKRKVVSIHQFDDPVKAVENAQAIAIGGGNTFYLLKQLYDNELIDAIRKKVNAGTPYMGWSAGSNMAGLTICTTNDMPIVQPRSFNALALVPFQINPHYTDYQPPNHNGETRAERIYEYTRANPHRYVVGIPEGTALERQGNQLFLRGAKDGLIFRDGEGIKSIKADSNISWLL